MFGGSARVSRGNVPPATKKPGSRAPSPCDPPHQTTSSGLVSSAISRTHLVSSGRLVCASSSISSAVNIGYLSCIGLTSVVLADGGLANKWSSPLKWSSPPSPGSNAAGAGTKGQSTQALLVVASRGDLVYQLRRCGSGHARSA